MGKRPNQTGSVYRDQRRGTYIGEVKLDGKRRRVTGPTKTETNKRLRALIRDHERGELSDGNATVAMAVEAWKSRQLAERDLAGKSIELYEWACALIVAELGSVRLKRLDVIRVERALDSLSAGSQGRELGRRSLTLVRSTLTQVLDFARRRRLIGSNPAGDAVLPPAAAGAVDRNALDARSSQRLWAALAEGGTYGALFRLQLATGLRPGEAAGLCWDCLALDGETPTLTVRRAVRMVAGRPVLVDELKTDGSQRTIMLPPEAVSDLRAQRLRVTELQLAAAAWPEPGLVFPSAAGTPLDASHRRRALKAFCATAEVPAVSPNELRHTAASLHVDRGASLVAVADMLGHSTPRMLTDTYRHQVQPVVAVSASMPWTVTEWADRTSAIAADPNLRTVRNARTVRRSTALRATHGSRFSTTTPSLYVRELATTPALNSEPMTNRSSSSAPPAPTPVAGGSLFSMPQPE